MTVSEKGLLLEASIGGDPGLFHRRMGREDHPQGGRVTRNRGDQVRSRGAQEPARRTPRSAATGTFMEGLVEAEPPDGFSLIGPPPRGVVPKLLSSWRS